MNEKLAEILIGYIDDDFIRGIQTIMWKGSDTAIVPLEVIHLLPWDLDFKFIDEEKRLVRATRTDRSEPDQYKIDEVTGRELVYRLNLPQLPSGGHLLSTPSILPPPI